MSRAWSGVVLVLMSVAAGCSSSGDGGGSAGGGGASSSAPLHCETTPGSDCICIGAGGSLEATPGATCGPSDLGGGFCCAEIGYPENGSCQCEHWGCNNSPSLCTCGVGDGTDPSCTGGFQHCCVSTVTLSNPASCSCSNFDCLADQTEVPSCGVEVTGCSGSKLPVSSCAP